MYKVIISTYETKQQELVDENNGLRNSLRELQAELQQVSFCVIQVVSFFNFLKLIWNSTLSLFVLVFFYFTVLCFQRGARKQIAFSSQFNFDFCPV